MVALTVTVQRERAPFGAGVRQGWYVLSRSRDLRAGAVLPVQVGDRRVVAWRDRAASPRVVSDRCAHLGADLSLGRVTDAGLRCAFHGWCWDAEGSCAAAPGMDAPPARRLRAYPVEERFGLLWAWLGDGPPFPLPAPPAHLPRALTLRAQRVRAHPDVVFSNGFDPAHLAPSHGIAARTTRVHEGPWTLEHRFEGRLPRRPALAWCGLGGAPVEASFTQHGGGIVMVHVRAPLELVILFTMRPEADGASRTRTVLFLRHLRDAPRALSLLWAIALDDIPLMESMAWTGAFAETDAVLARYARFVEELPAW